MKRIVSLAIVLVLFWYACQPEQPEKVILEFRFAETESAEGLTEITAQISDEKYFLHDEVVISNVDIESAFASTGEFGPQIEVIFTDSGGIKFSQLTEENIDRRLGILVDGEVVSAPLIKAKIPGGRAIIWGRWTMEEAERIAKCIVWK